MKKAAFYTLGCKLNYSETSAIGRLMHDHGFETIPFHEGADVYVINTCSVTENADKKCRKVIRQALKHSPDAYIVIVGCYAQLKPTEISEIPGVDLVLGAAEKFNIGQHLSDLTKQEKGKVITSEVENANVFIHAFSSGERTRSFLKVQDGCDYKCAFCTIPLARGKSRSDAIENVVANAHEIAKMGVQEIVLTGVNIGDYGKRVQKSEVRGQESGVRETEVQTAKGLVMGTACEKEINTEVTKVKHGKQSNNPTIQQFNNFSTIKFFDLVKALDEVPVSRIRISSIEPNLLTNEIIEFVAQSKRFMPHFHIPLQSGSNKILRMMRRRYRRELYADRVATIKSLMPHCCIGVDVIVGFPGETDEDFLDTYHFLNDLDVSYLHVFTYSERANTVALDFEPIVPMNVRRERSKMLRSLSHKKRRHFYEQHIGSVRKVLFEAENEAGQMYGFTDNYVKIVTDYDPLLVNDIRAMEMTGLTADNVATVTEAELVF